jgi:hypothetical protein
MAGNSAKARAATRSTKRVLRLFDARPDRLDFRDLPYRPPLIERIRGAPIASPLEWLDY